MHFPSLYSRFSELRPKICTLRKELGGFHLSIMSDSNVMPRPKVVSLINILMNKKNKIYMPCADVLRISSIWALTTELIFLFSFSWHHSYSENCIGIYNTFHYIYITSIAWYALFEGKNHRWFYFNPC
jgi:hypothetical protein